MIAWQGYDFLKKLLLLNFLYLTLWMRWNNWPPLPTQSRLNVRTWKKLARLGVTKTPYDDTTSTSTDTHDGKRKWDQFVIPPSLEFAPPRSKVFITEILSPMASASTFRALTSQLDQSLNASNMLAYLPSGL